MGQNSAIEWTDHTFNPWVGCVKVSPGCKFCYAEELMTRKGRWANTWGPAQAAERIKTSDSNWKEPLKWNRQAQAAGKRARVFCASLADVFEDNNQLYNWRIQLFGLISETPNLDWQILTKRPDVARTFFEQRPHLLMQNIWLGTSVENQQYANERIPELLKIPAAVLFLSVEPLLGPVSFDLIDGAIYDGGMPFEWQRLSKPGIDWVIVGGESGPNARPMNPQWARSIRDQCQAARIPFLFKQWGEFAYGDIEDDLNFAGGKAADMSNGGRMATNYDRFKLDDKTALIRVGKKSAGRLLDGRTWDEMPNKR